MPADGGEGRSLKQRLGVSVDDVRRLERRTPARGEHQVAVSIEKVSRKSPIVLPWRCVFSAAATLSTNYTTRLSTKIKSKETTDAIEVTRVSALSVPWVVSPTSDSNIQKKLLSLARRTAPRSRWPG